MRSTAGRIVFAAALVGLLIGGAILRFHLPVWPFADADTWGYINPAISKLSGGLFKHTQGRNFVYPGGIFILLGATRSFASITLAQHVLGLATGGLLLLAWFQWRKLDLRPQLPTSAHATLGLVLVAAYVLSNRPIQFEHTLRPEALTPFFAILNICFGLKFIEHRRIHSAHWKFVSLAMALLLNSLLLAFLKTSFALTAIISLLPALVWVFVANAPLWVRRLVFGIACGFALSLSVAEHLWARSDKEAKEFLPRSLFTIHANLIVQQMEEDLARGECGPRGCDRLRAIKVSLEDEMSKSWNYSHRYPSFGFDPDYLMYNDEALREWQDLFFDGDAKRQLFFYRFYFRRMVRHHPGWMLRKVVSQLGLFYGESNPSFDTRNADRLSVPYSRSVAGLTGYEDRELAIANYPPAREYLAQCRRFAQSSDSVRQVHAVVRLNKLLALLYRPILLLTIAGSFLVFASARLRSSAGDLTIGTLLIYVYSFGNTLGVAMLHSMHIPRYSYAQYSFALLSLFVGMAFVIELGCVLVRERRESRRPAPP